MMNEYNTEPTLYLTNSDIKERMEIDKSILSKSHLSFNNIKIAGYEVRFPQKSHYNHRTTFQVSPPFSYNKRKKYNFKFNSSYLDLYKRYNYYSLINIINFRSSRRNFVNECLLEVINEIIKEFCCTEYYTHAYLWTRAILESLLVRGHKIKVVESQLEINTDIFNPLLSDLESEDPDLIINLSWYPVKCDLNENILNLSIFNNIGY